MAVALSTGVELPVDVTPIRGGLLDRAGDLPDGWENGISVPFYSCGEPILRDKCIAGTDVPHRSATAEFDPFPIEQGSTCSTIGGDRVDDHALARLEATTEWALARQLQSDPVGTGSPKLDDAVSAGTAASIVTAVAMLEEAAAEAGFGSPWVLHAPVYAAAFLRRYNLIDDLGRTPAGGTWIISPGYDRPEGSIRLWVTGPVWAEVDTPQVFDGVDHRVNDIAAWALRVGLVAFDPCLNQYVDVTPLEGA